MYKKIVLILLLVLVVFSWGFRQSSQVVDLLIKDTTSISQQQYQKFIDYMLKCQMLVESDGKRLAHGDRGKSHGLYQLHRNEWNFTCRKLLGVKWSFDKDSWNASKNTVVGQTYMKYLIKKYNGDWGLALRAYNAGHRGATQLDRGWKYLDAVKKTMKMGSTKWRQKRR